MKTSSKIIILQRVCTSYRRDLFKKITAQSGWDLIVMFGESIPDS